MWLLFAMLTTLAWAAADLFYKKGSDRTDLTSHLKIVIAVGFVMGIQAIGYLIINGFSFNPWNLIYYFPVSFCYILSMTIGYIGLRYIELSIASPVQNSSGAFTLILCLIFFQTSLNPASLIGLVIVTSGVLILSILEKKEETNALVSTHRYVSSKYRLSFLAIFFPIAYCFIDGIGTFLDAVYLDEYSLINESDALLAYEFTFLIAAAIAAIYVYGFKKQRPSLHKDTSKLGAAVFETIGQYFYVLAMSRNAVITAPVIASYSIFSVLLSRIFLKERLSKKKYMIVLYVIFGIAILGLAEEL